MGPRIVWSGFGTYSVLWCPGADRGTEGAIGAGSLGCLGAGLKRLVASQASMTGVSTRESMNFGSAAAPTASTATMPIWMYSTVENACG